MICISSQVVLPIDKSAVRFGVDGHAALAISAPLSFPRRSVGFRGRRDARRRGGDLGTGRTGLPGRLPHFAPRAEAAASARSRECSAGIRTALLQPELSEG